MLVEVVELPGLPIGVVVAVEFAILDDVAVLVRAAADVVFTLFLTVVEPAVFLTKSSICVVKDQL